jgi:hypothetical protein
VYGVIIQALCGSDCHYLFVSVAALGKNKDSVASWQLSLQASVQALPPGCSFATDITYILSEHVITPYSSPQHYYECCRNFNCFLSQP